jgi:hypothetical protein
MRGRDYTVRIIQVVGVVCLAHILGVFKRCKP